MAEPIVDIPCPTCNPEGKERIRRLNKPSICLLCFNSGWVEFKDNKCCMCQKSCGIYRICKDCDDKISEPIRIERKFYVTYEGSN